MQAPALTPEAHIGSAEVLLKILSKRYAFSSGLGIISKKNDGFGRVRNICLPFDLRP